MSFEFRLRSIAAEKLEELKDLQGPVREENLLMSGPAGPGKSLSTVRPGKRAVRVLRERYRTYFIKERAVNEQLDNATAGYAGSRASGGNGEPIAQEVVQ